jgi:uncharacterized coiled-coil protein SlyX
MNNIVDIKDKAKPPRAASAGSGGGDNTIIETRVGNLEKSISEIEKTLSKMNDKLTEMPKMSDLYSIKVDIARIEAKLDSKASAVDLSEVKGQLKNMPSTWQLIVTLLSCMLGVAGFVFAIVKYVK